MFNCTKCKEHYRYIERRKRSCGFIPTDEWIESDALGFGRPKILTSDGVKHLDTCPGYTSQLPEVVEAASGWGWWEKGQLQLRYPDGPPHMLMDLIEAFHVANAQAQEYYMDQLSKGD